MWHESTGIIKYDPPRPGMKTRTNWWAIVKVDREITRYYRWWVNKEILNPLSINHDGISNAIAERYPTNQLYQPSWDAHIAIIRGEKPSPHLMHLWKKYDGKKITFKYKHLVRQSGNTIGYDRPDHFWFVDVDCPFLINIRKEFQIPHNWNLHLTIGRTY